jgi:transposase
VDEPFDRVQTGPSQIQTRLGEQQILKLIADYLAGSSITQLVKDFNVNRGTVYEHLKRADVPRRGGKLTPAQVIGLRTQHESGVSIAELAMKFGVSTSTIQRWLIDSESQPKRLDSGSQQETLDKLLSMKGGE